MDGAFVEATMSAKVTAYRREKIVRTTTGIDTLAGLL
jgi:hypothetical protein